MGEQDTTASLAERIDKVLRDSRLSMPAFSVRFAVSKSTLLNYRKGKRVPPADFLQALCKEFSVNPSWLLMGWGAPYVAQADAVSELLYIHPAVQIVENAAEEAGIELSNKQKEAIVQLVKEEMNRQASDVAKSFVRVLSGDRKNG